MGRAGWVSNVMAGGRGPVISLVPASQGGELLNPDSSSVEPGQHASLTGGEIPMDMLLSDPKISNDNDTIVLQQVPELISVGNSSVALIGTLWSVPKESRAEPAVAVDASGSQARPVTSPASPPPWAVFVIGVDEAFERSGHGAGMTIFSDSERPSEGHEASDPSVERLEGDARSSGWRK